MVDGDHDREARLLKLAHYLCNNPSGVTIPQMAEFCQVSERTIRRDLEALEASGAPIWEDEESGRHGITEGYYLPPVRITRPEALTLFLAVRLLLGYGNVYNPYIRSAFAQLNSIVPGPLREEISRTMQWMERQKKDDNFVHHLTTLTEAWMQRHPVQIRYWTLGQERAEDRVIEPYFIQPAAPQHGTYVIAFCRKHRDVRMFKIERVEAVKVLREQTYQVPATFDANQYFGSAMGVMVGGAPETVRLRFDRTIARIARETVWHSSQTTAMQADGSAIVTFNVPVTEEVANFARSWGEKVEVLEPESLRKQVAASAKAVAGIYRQPRKGPGSRS